MTGLKGTPSRKIQKKARESVRVLTLDIERIPGRATLQHRGLTVEGEFWDLNGWKHVIGRRIPADSVTAWPRSICAAAKWYDEPKVMFAAEWEDGGNERFMAETWQWFHEADLIVGHNMGGFDEKHLRGGWLEYGWTPPSPWKTVDTLKIARSEFNFESNTLDALCQRLGVKAKTDKYDAKVAHAAIDGDAKAQRKLRAYNIGDIRATEGIYDRLRPYIKNHPHLGQFTGDSWSCANCGWTDLSNSRDGDAHTFLQRYRRYACPKCGSWMRGNIRLQDPVQTRPLK